MLRWVLREAGRRGVSVDAPDGNHHTAMNKAISLDWVDGMHVLIKEGGADPLRRSDQVRKGGRDGSLGTRVSIHTRTRKDSPCQLINAVRFISKISTGTHLLDGRRLH